MILESEYLTVVSETKADITSFIDIAVNDNSFRYLLVKHLLHHRAINVYYHSYMIIKEVTATHPHCFYSYWNNFATLLLHQNSYHRNYGIDLLTNLIAVDEDKKFDTVFEDYYNRLYDEKISTIKYCISNSVAIIDNRTDLADIILSEILNSLRRNSNTERHQNYLLSEFIDLLYLVLDNINDKKGISLFLMEILVDNKSEKVRRKIRKVLKEIETVNCQK